MVELSGLVAGGFFCLVSLWFGYRATTAATLYRSLRGTDPDGSTGLVDGEPVAIEGEVVVDEPADAADRAVDDSTSPIAAYVWRARFPNAGKNVIDFENRELRQGMATFASGIEWGRFAVADGGEAFRVDPEWLAETHDSTALTELTVGGVNGSETFATYLWDSPYLSLDGVPSEPPLDRLTDLIDTHHGDVDLDRYAFESKPIAEGETVAVRGEVDLDRDEPLVRGSDDTPLVISDRGFDTLRSELGNGLLKYGSLSMASLAVASVFLI